MEKLEDAADKLFNPEFLEIARTQFAKNSHPLFNELKPEVLGVGEGRAVMRLPYDERFVGDPVSGSLHGGVIATLMDSVAGLCVMATIKLPVPIATLDLRMDYLRPTKRGEDIIAEVECYHFTKTVAFVRGYARQGDPLEPVAHCNASFMLSTKGPKAPEPGPFSSLVTQEDPK